MWLRRNITKLFLVIAVLRIDSAHAQTNTPDRARTLRAAADALGMVRWSDIGADAARLPGIDVVNTMEFEAAGTGTEYPISLGLNLPAVTGVVRLPQQPIQQDPQSN